MEDKEKLTKEYEIGVLVRKEEDLPAVRRAVEQHGGAITADFRARKVALAYPIQKEENAVFAFSLFSAEPAQAKQLEQDLTTESAVLRSIIVIPFKASASAGTGTGRKWERTGRQTAPAEGARTSSAATNVLSNEALEKKIEEMLK
jgi:ribosomal protein S6